MRKQIKLLALCGLSLLAVSGFAETSNVDDPTVFSVSNDVDLNNDGALGAQNNGTVHIYCDQGGLSGDYQMDSFASRRWSSFIDTKSCSINLTYPSGGWTDLGTLNVDNSTKSFSLDSKDPRLTLTTTTSPDDKTKQIPFLLFYDTTSK